ncbi:SsgA family sporulation/cell division regulator [Streptomyces sp. RY43-2]|uniref:SsgA family sporulation/cell division regulator n=1 Tax=Streptomyces macrolidinus TaxID=2952607 RepID=A0ABT0ZEH0_9ACTN|nr:SsgA family sporulation/cell division regulator [Streptomyces macrolidinus]MCN9241970.1 SsgA family sporulation/cell division regulator [Streptomyces macrolidinus]
MSVVEQYARAHVVTDSPDTPDAIPVLLRYDPSTDPLSVRIGLPGPQEWALSRDLLEEGLRAPARKDDISIWPCGRVQAVVEFHSPAGVEVVQFESQTLLRFLRRTYLAGTTNH